MRFVKGFLVNPADRAIVDFMSKPRTNIEVGRIAENGPKCDNPRKPPGINCPRCCHGAGNKQK